MSGPPGAVVEVQVLEPRGHEALDKFEEFTDQGSEKLLGGGRRYLFQSAESWGQACDGMRKMLDQLAPGWQGSIGFVDTPAK